MREGFCGSADAPASLAACGCCAGMNFSTRNVIQPTGSPCWSAKSVRVVMKYPTPAPVAFSSLISAMIVVAWTTSPGLR